MTRTPDEIRRDAKKYLGVYVGFDDTLPLWHLRLIRELLAALEAAESALAVSQRERDELREAAEFKSLFTLTAQEQAWIEDYRRGLIKLLYSSPASLSERETEQEKP